MDNPVTLDVVPQGKPRMVRSDAWAKRPSVENYWAYKDELNLRANAARYALGERLAIKFYIPMPASWSKKRRAEMAGTPHQGKPDIDNLLKAFMDCLTDDDAGIWEVRASKFWAVKGKIELESIDAE